MGLRTRTGTVGQLYAVEVSRGVWAAARVVTDEGGMIRLLALDWFGPAPPTPAALRGCRPLVQDHHSWPGTALTMRVARAELPDTFVPVGRSLARSLPKDRRGESPSGFVLQLALQERWLRAPQAARRRYKQALRADRELDIRLGPNDPPNPIAAKATSARVVPPDADRYGNTIATAAARPNWPALDALAALGDLAYSGDDLGLIGYLEGRPLLQGVGWLNDAIVELDLSRTHLTDVSVVAAKLARLRLPPCCDELHLRFIDVRVDHVDAGAQLTLRVTHPTQSFRLLRGLQRVRRLELSFVEELDCSELLCFPELEHVKLHDVTRLRSVERLAELRGMRRLQLDSCYDFDGERLPVPSAWPDLLYMSIDGLRKRDATVLKRHARGDKRLEMRGAKTEVWLQTNLNNPFRDWTDHHAARKAKAASAAYTAAVKAIEARAEELDAVLKRFVDVFNDIDARDIVDTADRDDVYDAFFRLVEQAGADIDEYEAKLDEWRDF